ncbi:hypothetical protein DDZ14_18125 [Maritimibacter sp. 55A14]|nr:hypothetical protein DDZ14_18125 [Maritimibacter sp. 55A14]
MAAGLGGGAANAATYPTFVLDTDASSISTNITGSICLSCSITGNFASGAQNFSWTPTSPTDSIFVNDFFVWDVSGFGGATFDVQVDLAFSDPDAASTSGSGSGFFKTFFGKFSGGGLWWTSTPSVTFAQGSVLDVVFEGPSVLGWGNSVETGATFTGAPISPVPLPSAGLLLLGALGGVGFAARRKRRAA